MAKTPKAAPKAAEQPKSQEKAGVPAVQPQAGGAVTKADMQDMILVGDKHDLSHIKSGRGNENVGIEDLVIPRLEIVQGLSPALKPGDPGFIEGAKQGDLINSVTNRVYGREVFVVPVHYTKQWLVWKKFSEGGGFFGAYPNPEEAKARADEEGGEKNHIEVIDTPTHLCLLVNFNEGRVEEIMVPMTKTKAKVSRAWNTMVRMAQVDRFGRAYRIGTALEKNKKNQEYWNYVVAQSGAPHLKLYALAEKLFQQVSTGARNVVMDTKNMGRTGEGDDAEM